MISKASSIVLTLSLLLSTFHMPTINGSPTSGNEVAQRLYEEQLYKLIMESSNNQLIFQGGQPWKFCNLDQLVVPASKTKTLSFALRTEIQDFKNPDTLNKLITKLVQDCQAHHRISLVCLYGRQEIQGKPGCVEIQAPGTMINLEHNASLQHHMFMSLIMVALFYTDECYVIESKHTCQLRLVLRNRYELSEPKNGRKVMDDIRKKLQEEAGIEDYLQWPEINTDDWNIRFKASLKTGGNEDPILKLQLFDSEETISFIFEYTRDSSPSLCRWIGP